MSRGFLAPVGLALLLALAACGPGPALAPSSSSEEIGVVLSLTGNVSIQAGPVTQGAALAIASVNATRPASTRAFALRTADDAGTTSGATAACNRLASGGVLAIVGAESAAGREACSRAAAAHRIPYLAVGEAAADECYPGAFFAGPTAGQAGAAIAAWLHGPGAGSRALVVEPAPGADPASRLGQAEAAAFAAALTAAGGAVEGSVSVAADATEFSDALASIASARPDVVVDALVGAQESAFEQQLASDPALRSLPRAAIAVPPGAAVQAGAPLAGVIVAGDYLTADPASANQAWLSDLVRRFGDGAVPSAEGAETYDAIELAAAAAERAGTAGAAGVGDALPAVSFTGPRGPVQIDSGRHGHATLTMHVGRVGAGGMVDQVAVSAPLQPSPACV